MPNSNTNAGLSLEALLAAARGAEEETAGSPAAPDIAASAAPADASTESAEPAAEPSAAVQEEALEQAEEKGESAAPAFDLAAALGYGPRDSEPVSAAKEPEEKFDLAAALGYKSQEEREREAAEAAAAEAAAQAQAVQAHAFREAEREARRESAMRDMQKAPSAQEEQLKRQERADRIEKLTRQDARASRGERDVATVSAADIPQVRSRSFDPAAKSSAVSPEERYAAKNTAAKSATATDGSTIESYQPTKRDRSAQARAARPLNKDEVSEVAQAIAADAARIEYAEPDDEAKAEATVSKSAAESSKDAPAQPASDAKESKESKESKEDSGESAPAPSAAEDEKVPRASSHEVAEVLKESIPAVVEPAAAEPAAPTSQPVVVEEKPAVSEPAQVQAPAPAKATEAPSVAPEPVGQPLPVIPPAAPVKPVTMPHKVPVRTTEEIINPVQAPVRLGVISPETARHEAAAKKKVQSTERKIVKKVRRFRTLGMFLIVVALASLAGAIFLFVAGNAQANESIEATATEICEQAGRTITYRYKAADSNGTLCPTTEVATFSAGDVLEQSVITMNTPDFETAAHTLANFKKQFEKNSYVDGRVDGSTVIFTLHMSNERIMKVTYTALLMKNTTGCEVII